MKINARIKITPPKSPDSAAVIAALEGIVRTAAGFDGAPLDIWDEHVGRKLRAGVPVDLAFEPEEFARFILLRRAAQKGTDVLKAGDSYKRLTWQPIEGGVES